MLLLNIFCRDDVHFFALLPFSKSSDVHVPFRVHSHNHLSQKGITSHRHHARKRFALPPRTLWWNYDTLRYTLLYGPRAAAGLTAYFCATEAGTGPNCIAFEYFTLPLFCVRYEYC